jgi:hypothetical protein
MEMARQKCLELHARVIHPPAGPEEPLPTAPLTEREAGSWCMTSQDWAWWYFDDVLKSATDDPHAQARCAEVEALVDPSIVVLRGWRAEFVPKYR